MLVGMYSVMADTTPDTSNKNRMAIAVRFVDKNEEGKECIL